MVSKSALILPHPSQQDRDSPPPGGCNPFFPCCFWGLPLPSTHAGGIRAIRAGFVPHPGGRAGSEEGASPPTPSHQGLGPCCPQDWEEGTFFLRYKLSPASPLPEGQSPRRARPRAPRERSPWVFQNPWGVTGRASGNGAQPLQPFLHPVYWESFKP